MFKTLLIKEFWTLISIKKTPISLYIEKDWLLILVNRNQLKIISLIFTTIQLIKYIILNAYVNIF